MRARLFIGLSLFAAALASAADAPAYRVIVNPENPATTLERKQVADLFLKKVTRWPEGSLVAKPVDQTVKAPCRARFSDELLGRSISAVKTFWEQVIFSGRGVPPPELAGDAEVVQYVLRYPGAIGYISGAADAGTAKVLGVK